MWIYLYIFNRLLIQYFPKVVGAYTNNPVFWIKRKDSTDLMSGEILPSYGLSKPPMDYLNQ